MSLNTDALTTVQAVKDELGNQGANVVRIERHINAYSPAIRHFTGRQFFSEGASATEKVFPYDGQGYLSLEPYEARTVTAVKLYRDSATLVQTYAAIDWHPYPRQKTTEQTYLWLALAKFGRGGLPVANRALLDVMQDDVYDLYDVGVTGTWGAASVPGDVAMACIIACVNAYRHEEGYVTRTVDDLGAAREAEAEEFVEPMSLPRDSRALLLPYRRQRARHRNRTGVTA